MRHYWQLMSAAFGTANGGVLHRIDRHKRLSALLFGAVLPLGFAPFFWLPVYYLALAAFFWLWWRACGSIRQQAILGFCFGFGQFFTGLIWVGEAFLVEAELFLWLLPFAVTLMPAGLAVFIAAAAALSGWCVVRFNLVKLPALLVLVLGLSLADLARAHILTGLPWNQPEQAWAGVLPLAQSLAYLGAHGTALLVMLSAALMAAASRRTLLLALAVPLVVGVLGGVRLHQHPSVSGTLPVMLVQPNIPQREKWQPDLRQKHIDGVLRMTATGLQAMPQLGLIIWPETALPALIDEGTGFADLIRARLPQTRPTGVALLTGAVRRQKTFDGTYAYFNSAQLWTTSGLFLAHSDKHQLVPFGEYLPMQSLLEAIGLQQLTRLRGGYHAGAADARLSVPGLPLIAPLICYEAIFPALAAGAPRPDVLINLTNDGWFGDSIGPHQHFTQARLRAIEQGLPLIRVANTGISAVVDAQGRIRAKIELGRRGIHIETLPPTAPPTLYARIGLWGYGLLILLLGLTIFILQNRRKLFGIG